MTTVTFDTGLAVENLQQNGFDLTQSRGVVEVIKTAQTELATKHDLALLRRDMMLWHGSITIAAFTAFFVLFQAFPPG